MITRLCLLALFSFPLLSNCTPADASARVASRLPSRVAIASAREPGERLVITGRVLTRNGVPRGGVVIQAHHTDAKGVYLAEGEKAANPKASARLWGELQTADDGTYRIETIKPHGYPGGGVPAHVHIVVRDGRHEQFEILQFAGDPALTPAMIELDGKGGTFAGIRPLQRDARGVLQCTRDIRLKGN